MRWLLVRLLMVIAVAPAAIAYMMLGYRFDWPTMVYTLIVVAIVNAVREMAE